MDNDEKCIYREACGYDFCHGEGICPEFEKGKPPKETEKESEVEEEWVGLFAKKNISKKQENRTSVYSAGAQSQQGRQTYIIGRDYVKAIFKTRMLAIGVKTIKAV